MKLYSAIKAASKKMAIDFEEISSQIQHRGVKGDVREDILKEFLKKYLPEKYGIAKGLVIDVNGKQSKQQDILIYDKSITPVFFLSQSETILPIESVLSIIEVKSVLNKKQLIEALENIKSVKELEKNYLNKKSTNIYPFGFIFCYTSSIQLDDIRKQYRDFFNSNAKEHIPTAIFCLDKGSLVHYNRTNLFSIDLALTNPAFGINNVEEKSDNLMLFYILIVASLLYEESAEKNFPDISTYAIKSGFVNPKTSISNEDSVAAKVVMDDIVFDLDKMKELQKYFKEDKNSLHSAADILNIINDASDGKFLKYTANGLNNNTTEHDKK